MDGSSRLNENQAGEEIDYGLLKKNVLLQGSNSYCQLHQEYLIYRVPPVLRQGNEAAFEPHIVSIGPYHRKMECVQAMKEHKKRYLHHLLLQRPGASFEDLARNLAKIEERTRGCYSENVDLTRTDFVEMMCLDGCFIVELFLKIKEKKDDELLTGPIWRLNNILRDILLLENQLPFFVLVNIFDFIKPKEQNQEPKQLLVHYCLNIFDIYNDQWRNKNVPDMEPHDIHHLLHLFYTHILPWPRPNQNNCKSPTESSKSKCLPLSSKRTSPATQVNSMPSANSLVEKRVHFRKKEEEGSFLEITFRHRVLEIPYLKVDDHTESMVRNCIAFEQCCLNARSHLHQFGAYVRLMDSIVNTQKDVEVLKRAGIMEHKLGSDKDVARLFNKLNQGVIVNLKDTHLFDVFNRVDDHCKKVWNEWIADFKHRYFTSPWACLAMTAAILGLSLTILSACINLANYTRLRRK